MSKYDKSPFNDKDEIMYEESKYEIMERDEENWFNEEELSDSTLLNDYSVKRMLKYDEVYGEEEDRNISENEVSYEIILEIKEICQ